MLREPRSNIVFLKGPVAVACVYLQVIKGRTGRLLCTARPAQGKRTRTDHCHSGHIAVGQVRGPLLACQSEHELPVCLPACPLANLGVDKVLLKGLTWLAKDNNNNKIKSFLLSFEYLMMRHRRQSRSCYSYSRWLYPLYLTSSYTHRGAESLSQRSSGPMLSEISTMQLSAKSQANRATHYHR